MKAVNRSIIIFFLAMTILATAHLAEAGIKSINYDNASDETIVSYEVKKGDTLWGIGEILYLGKITLELIEADIQIPNEITDPSKLKSGKILVIRSKSLNHLRSKVEDKEKKPAIATMSPDQLQAEFGETGEESEWTNRRQADSLQKGKSETSDKVYFLPYSNVEKKEGFAIGLGGRHVIATLTIPFMLFFVLVFFAGSFFERKRWEKKLVEEAESVRRKEELRENEKMEKITAGIDLLEGVGSKAINPEEEILELTEEVSIEEEISNLLDGIFKEEKR